MQVAQESTYVRVFDPATDAKEVRMLIGQGVMEGLAHANRKVLTYPLSLTVWVGLAAVFNYATGLVPKSGEPLTYLSPLIGFAAVALPLMFIPEYLHRPIFTRLMRETLGAPDVVALPKFYALDERSKIIVLEHEKEVQGVVCLDGRRAGEDLGTVLGAEEGDLGDKGVIESAGVGTQKGGRKTVATLGANPGVVEIRHLDVDIPLRQAGVTMELLAAALDHAFCVKPFSNAKFSPTTKVIYRTNPFVTDEEAFRRCGFVTSAGPWSEAIGVGLFNWKGRWLEVTPAVWDAKRSNVYRS
ncbi:hypothetical protein BCR39DRAFT_596661 [Naematelia encephala]|uniref:N-acetyltransferase domain-containing protein n=1 Tax=Naematelia encephala TaxID=71784 RepID=A0A1Y2BJ08_9TREE|nr:hypothetical protein BCR39DRAFT_596661 [Naematelia encephala]